MSKQAGDSGGTPPEQPRQSLRTRTKMALTFQKKADRPLTMFYSHKNKTDVFIPSIFEHPNDKTQMLTLDSDSHYLGL